MFGLYLGTGSSTLFEGHLLYASKLDFYPKIIIKYVKTNRTDPVGSSQQDRTKIAISVSDGHTVRGAWI